MFGPGSDFHVEGMWKGLIDVFRDFFASISEALILAGWVGAGLSYYGVGAFSWCSVVPLGWGGVGGCGVAMGFEFGGGLGGFPGAVILILVG